MHEKWKFDHVSLVVRSMDSAISEFEALGVGPLPPFLGGPGMPFGGKTVRGRSCEYDMDLRNAEGGFGGLKLEVIEPLGGDSILGEFLDEQGGGLHHIAFAVEDLDCEIADMEERGFKVMQTGALGTAKWAYFAGEKLGGLVIELLQPPADA